MRFFLFTLTVLSNCVFASCPTDEYVGAFEMGDAPALICIDYESTKCTAKCGQTTGGVCTMVQGKWGPFALTGESCDTSDNGGGTGETGGGNTTSGATGTGGNTTSGATGTGGSGSGVVDTGGASCGTGTGCTFNPKGFYTTPSNPSDYALQQIHGVLNSLTTVTTFSSNAANSTLSAISTSLNSFSNAYQNNSITSNNAATNANEHLANIEWRLNNPVSSGSPNYMEILSSINKSTQMTAGMSNNIYSDFRGRITGLDNMISSNFSTSNMLQDMQLQKANDEIALLSDIKTLLSNSPSSGSSTGGSQSSGDIGSSSNPGHLKDASYIRCDNCTFDIQGANVRLDDAKAELSKTLDEIKTKAGETLAFNFQGSNEVSDCYDFLPDWVGQSVCINTGSLWSIIGSLIFIICVMAALYIVMGD